MTASLFPLSPSSPTSSGHDQVSAQEAAARRSKERARAGEQGARAPAWSSPPTPSPAAVRASSSSSSSVSGIEVAAVESCPGATATFHLCVLHPIHPRVAMESRQGGSTGSSCSGSLPSLPSQATRERSGRFCLCNYAIGDEKFCIEGTSTVCEVKG